MGVLIDVDDEHDRIPFLVNFLSRLQMGPGTPWSVRRAQKEHTDEMGVVVKRGERYFVRRDESDVITLRKLSLTSGRLLWGLFIVDNDLKNRMVQKMLEVEEVALRQMGYGPSALEAMQELRDEGSSNNQKE